MRLQQHLRYNHIIKPAITHFQDNLDFKRLHMCIAVGALTFKKYNIYIYVYILYIYISLYISSRKLFSISRYLGFCFDLLIINQNGLIKKMRLVSNFMMSQPD